MRSGVAKLRRVWDGLMPSTVRAGLDATVADERGRWLADRVEDYCHRCGASAGPGSVTANGCTFCLNDKLAWDRMVRLSAYAPPMDGWIKAMKFGRDWGWAEFFGRELAGCMGPPLDRDRVLICAVPMPHRRRWSRGYNQAKLMADALAKSTGLPRLDALKRCRYTRPQTLVVNSQRQANIANSLAIHPLDLSGWEVWLIDDVKTTGSTLSACARLLRKSGARSIRVGVAAVADPRRSHFLIK